MKAACRASTCCARIFGGVIGWPSADAAYFAELAWAGLPPPPSKPNSQISDRFAIWIYSVCRYSASDNLLANNQSYGLLVEKRLRDRRWIGGSGSLPRGRRPLPRRRRRWPPLADALNMLEAHLDGVVGPDKEPVFAHKVYQPGFGERQQHVPIRVCYCNLEPVEYRTQRYDWFQIERAGQELIPGFPEICTPDADLSGLVRRSNLCRWPLHEIKTLLKWHADREKNKSMRSDGRTHAPSRGSRSRFFGLPGRAWWSRRGLSRTLGACSWLAFN